jgi:hypothetical protein
MAPKKLERLRWFQHPTLTHSFPQPAPNPFVQHSLKPELIAFTQQLDPGTINKMAELTLNDVMNAVTALSTRMDTRLGQIDTRLGHIDTHLGHIDTRLDQMDTRLSELCAGQDILRAKQENSMKGRRDLLARITKPDGTQPTCEYPVIEELLVGGSETLPSGNENNWSASKSLQLIREYEPGYATDGEAGDETRSRPRRLKVAQLLGVTTGQLNFGLLTM